jgi:hypothetical protein
MRCPVNDCWYVALKAVKIALMLPVPATDYSSDTEGSDSKGEIGLRWLCVASSFEQVKNLAS